MKAEILSLINFQIIFLFIINLLIKKIGFEILFLF